MCPAVAYNEEEKKEFGEDEEDIEGLEIRDDLDMY